MSQFISVFDMFKIGVGPSSSHTLGPWKAASIWIQQLKNSQKFDEIDQIRVDVYGSLSLTGKGHATDLAILLGLSEADPEYIPIEDIFIIVNRINIQEQIYCKGGKKIPFFKDSIVFNKEFLPEHPNALIFRGFRNGKEISTATFYSIGGGFVVQENPVAQHVMLDELRFPYPILKATELESFCEKENLSISEIVFKNELVLKDTDKIDFELKRIWQVMLESMYLGCHTEGELPGGLRVKRRAFDTHATLIKGASYSDPEDWMTAIRNTNVKFREILKWVSCFALSVNEVNASLGRIVTAPTNGSAGVIPAVLMYYLVIENHKADFKHIKKFLLTAGEIGSIFKKNATISAAMGGCQAEIGVSSAMAAAALTELLGGSAAQCIVAAEIAMEHHLGLTCDPIGGLVQIPCIERNAMGAIKAINAAEMALDVDPKNVKVPLDKVIHTMWETAKDMNKKYKETSEGGLAVNVGLADC